MGWVSDLARQAEIEVVVKPLGYQLHWVASAEQLGTHELNDRPGEPLRGGQTSELLEILTRELPELLLVDLDNTTIPWGRWLGLVKSSPATRRLPVVAFGDPAHFALAQQMGSARVVTWAQFSAQAAELINTHAKQIDYLAIAASCAQPLPQVAQEALALFNQGQFYEAHHGLEAAWNADDSPARDLYRALLQLAVAYLQLRRGNYRGAIKLLMRAEQWLDPLPDRCRGVDLGAARQSARVVYEQLRELGEARIGEFDQGLFRPISYQTE